MKKAGQVAQDMCHEFLQVTSNLKLLVKVNGAGSGEGYAAKRWGSEIQINAESPLAAAYGVAQLTVGIRSGHLSDFLGAHRPKFNLRPLWMRCRCAVSLSPGFSLPIPELICDLQNIDLLCRRTIEMGYNALIFSQFGECIDLLQPMSCDGVAICKQIMEYGIKIIAQPVFDPFNLEKLPEQLSSLSFLYALFWRARFYDASSPFAKDNSATELEKALAEVRALERTLPDSLALIYYVPAPDLKKAKRQSQWMMRFCDDVGEKTAIAFSAVAGEPSWDHLPRHPLWEILRRLPDESATPFLPVLNIGGIEQGEGLWPSLNVDLVEAFFSRCFRHRFAGIAVLAAYLPRSGSFLDCNLFVAAQAMWGNLSPALLAESWFSAFRPDLDLERFSTLFCDVRKVSSQLGEMRFHLSSLKKMEPENAKTLAEAILAKLQRFDFLMAQLPQERQSQRPTIRAYMHYFVRDAKRIVFHFLQANHLPVPGSLKGDELGPSFWTHLLPAASVSAFASQPEIALNRLPDPGVAGSVQQQIYLETNMASAYNSRNSP